MKYFKNKDILDYLYQNYTKADGLWFLKVEELYGFDKALEIDTRVWKVIPKLQARFIKKILLEAFQKDGIADSRTAQNQAAKNLLFEALKIKLSLDRFEYKVSKNKAAIIVRIDRCPWHEIMVKAQRKTFSEKIGSAICNNEYSAFIAEFFPDAVIEISSKLCNGNDCCNFKFSIKIPD
jgi:hypothetical protein